MRNIVVGSAGRGWVLRRGLFVGILLSGALFAGAAQARTPEIESKQAEVDQAQAQIQATLEDLSKTQASYEESQRKLQDVEGEIFSNRRDLKETKGDLTTAREKLSDRAVGSYKSDGVMYLDVLLSVRSFKDLSEKTRFVMRVLNQDRAAIKDMKDVKERLAGEREALKSKQEKQSDISARIREEQAAMDERLAEQRDTYNSLSSEVRSLVQEEQQRQVREAAERRAQAAASARKLAEQQAEAEKEAAVQVARQQVRQLPAATAKTSADVERQAVAETEARRERQRLAVEAAEADKRAQEAKEKAAREAAQREAEQARKAAEKQAAAEEAARAEQERLLAEAKRQAQERQAEQGRQQQAAQQQAAKREAEAAQAQYADGGEEKAAQAQYAEEDASAAESQYDESSATDTGSSDSGTQAAEEPSVTSSDPRVQAILDSPNITLTAMAQQDLAAGVIDSRVLDVVEFASQEHAISISVFKTGHPYGATLDALGYVGYPNSHYFGRAVDIYAVDGVAVSSGNATAQALAQSIFDNFGPAELGSPWLFGSGSFSDALHQDHIHVGWPYGADGGL